MADRYTYIPLIGLFIMAAWGIPEIFKKWRYRKEVLVASSALFLSCLFILTWTQVGYWRDSITLYDHALNVTNRNNIIHNNRGVCLLHALAITGRRLRILTGHRDQPRICGGL